MNKRKKIKQTGKSNIKRDKIFKALKPGKRKGKKGYYYEYRANRSDKNRRKKL